MSSSRLFCGILAVAAGLVCPAGESAADSRPEILVQGSADGETWVDYEFRDKPDRLDERPSWVQPHMPRLDWRLWFEALAWEGATSPPRPYQPHDWFASFLERLREGEPAVVGLLAFDPTPVPRPSRRS